MNHFRRLRFRRVTLYDSDQGKTAAAKQQESPRPSVIV